MRQLDAGSLYQDQIAKEVEKLLPKASAASVPTPQPVVAQVANACTACAAANDPDAKFCKNCGARLEAAS